jgi:hypothetical protein
MPVRYNAWQHREGYATVTIDGDTATAVSPFLHLRQTWDGSANLLHAGMWRDRLARFPQGLRITHGRLQDLFFNTFPGSRTPPFCDLTIPPLVDQEAADTSQLRRTLEPLHRKTKS